MRYKALWPALLLLAGCTSSALYYAKSAPTGEEGMRVELEGGTFSGGVNGQLENVGEFVKIPNGYRGAVPPNWVVYEGPTPQPEPETDEETAATPPSPGDSQ